MLHVPSVPPSPATLHFPCSQLSSSLLFCPAVTGLYPTLSLSFSPTVTLMVLGSISAGLHVLHLLMPFWSETSVSLMLTSLKSLETVTNRRSIYTINKQDHTGKVVHIYRPTPDHTLISRLQYTLLDFFLILLSNPVSSHLLSFLTVT